MTQTVRDFENTFARALVLLVRNWIIVLPGIVLGIAGGILNFAISFLFLGSFALTGEGGENVAFVTQTIVAIVLTTVAMLIAIVQMAIVTGMAGAAWRHGRATIADGWSAFAHHGVQVALAVVLLFLIGLCAAALAPITFLVTLFAYMVFVIYTMASVIIGGRNAVEGIAESCRLALQNIAPTLGVIALITLIAFGGAWAGMLVGRLTPLGGGVVAGVLEQIIVAYASLVVAGEYLKLVKQPTA